MKQDYDAKLIKSISLTSRNQQLLLELKSLDKKPEKNIDYAEEKKILLNTLDTLKISKDMARKIITNLSEELIAYKMKEHDANIQAEIEENFLNIQNSHFTRIEDEINREIQRLESEFIRKYNEKLKMKDKFDKNDWKLRVEVLPKLTKLDYLLFDEREKLKKVEMEIAEIKMQWKENLKLEQEYSPKLKELSKEYQKCLEESKIMENDIKALENSININSKEIERFKKEFEENLQNVKENSLINQRMKEIYACELNNKNEMLKNSTICKLENQELTIHALRQKICQMLQEISKSNDTIKILEYDIDYLLDKNPKPTIGHDYVGNTFIQLQRN